MGARLRDEAEDGDEWPGEDTSLPSRKFGDGVGPRSEAFLRAALAVQPLVKCGSKELRAGGGPDCIAQRHLLEGEEKVGGGLDAHRYRGDFGMLSFGHQLAELFLIERSGPFFVGFPFVATFPAEVFLTVEAFAKMAQKFSAAALCWCGHMLTTDESEAARGGVLVIGHGDRADGPLECESRPTMSRRKSREKSPWFIRHSLSIVAAILLLTWIAGYLWLNPESRLSAFCGNAIADWSGSLVIILGTKFFYEIGSKESRPVRRRSPNPLWEFLREHSLLIFIGVTGVGWALLFLRMNQDSKWGQVVGNLVSEWGQMAGLVFLTKRLVEVGSKP